MGNLLMGVWTRQVIRDYKDPTYSIYSELVGVKVEHCPPAQKKKKFVFLSLEYIFKAPKVAHQFYIIHI